MVERGIDIGARRIEVPLASNPEGIDAIGFELVEPRFTCLSGPIERRVVDGVEEAQALVRKRPPVQREPGAVNAKHVGHRSIVRSIHLPSPDPRQHSDCHGVPSCRPIRKRQRPAAGSRDCPLPGLKRLTPFQAVGEVGQRRRPAPLVGVCRVDTHGLVPSNAPDNTNVAVGANEETSSVPSIASVSLLTAPSGYPARPSSARPGRCGPGRSGAPSPPLRPRPGRPASP